MSITKKLSDLKQAQTHIEALEKLHDLYPQEVPYICDFDAIELGMAIDTLESQSGKRPAVKSAAQSVR